MCRRKKIIGQNGLGVKKKQLNKAKGTLKEFMKLWHLNWILKEIDFPMEEKEKEGRFMLKKKKKSRSKGTEEKMYGKIQMLQHE